MVLPDESASSALAPVPAAPPAVVSHPDHTGWSDSSARAVLQLMVESVAEMIGFEVAALSVVLDDELVTMAYTGPEEFRDYLIENADPLSILDPILERGDVWGRFRFLPAERYDGSLEGHWVVVSGERGTHADAWDPLDVLIGLLTDDDGRLVATLSVDNPVSGRRPDDRQRRLLERYAAQAERAVLTALEREALVQQVAHAETTRRLIRSTSMSAQASLDELLRHTHGPLVEGFGASGSWILVLEEGGPGLAYARAHDGEMVHLSDEVVDVACALAPQLWEEQRVLVLSAGESTEVSAAVHHQLADLELSHVLAVPLGVGPECVGFLVLTRRAQDPPWSAVETASALEVGHDLGAALRTVGALESERELVRELQQLDDYRSQLIATLSHELRTPLTVISGNLELLEMQGGVPQSAERFVEAMARGTDRMQKVVDDLLLLARVSHPQYPLVRAGVDLAGVTREAALLVESAARAKDQQLTVDTGPGPLEVCGDPAELDRMVGNLVSNAVKYTPSGGRIRVIATLEDGEVFVRVSDDGIGISEEDQAGLFGAFFRTTNPEALIESGTGLGLAIVASIVERHGGRVSVSSELGVGTTFTVALPSVGE